VSHRAFLTWLGSAWLEKLEPAREPARLMRSFNPLIETNQMVVKLSFYVQY
jgi:hypothetical protein